jgi:hypothetical protein
MISHFIVRSNPLNLLDSRTVILESQAARMHARVREAHFLRSPSPATFRKIRIGHGGGGGDAFAYVDTSMARSSLPVIEMFARSADFNFLKSDVESSMFRLVRALLGFLINAFRNASSLNAVRMTFVRVVFIRYSFLPLEVESLAR